MTEIRYSPEFETNFVDLKTRAERGEGEARYLLERIRLVAVKLTQNLEAGIKIPRKLWPDEYVQTYGITNLWKINLDSNWRLLYTVLGNQVNFFIIYIEYMKHKEYDRKFGYKKT